LKWVLFSDSFSAFKLVPALIRTFSKMLLEPVISRRAAVLRGLQMTSPA